MYYNLTRFDVRKAQVSVTHATFLLCVIECMEKSHFLKQVQFLIEPPITMSTKGLSVLYRQFQVLMTVAMTIAV